MVVIFNQDCMRCGGISRAAICPTTPTQQARWPSSLMHVNTSVSATKTQCIHTWGIQRHRFFAQSLFHIPSNGQLKL